MSIADQFKNVNWRDLPNAPPAPKFVALVALLIAVVAAGFYFYWMPLQEELSGAAAISCGTVDQRVAGRAPHIEGATFVGNKSCADCHTNIVRGFTASAHARRLAASGSPSRSSIAFSAEFTHFSPHPPSSAASAGPIGPALASKTATTPAIVSADTGASGSRRFHPSS